GRRPAGARPANLLRGGARYPSLLATTVAADRASLPPRGAIRDALPWLRGPTRWPEDGRTSGAIPPVGVSGNIRCGVSGWHGWRRHTYRRARGDTDDVSRHRIFTQRIARHRNASH